MFVHFRALLFKPRESVKSALETPNLGLGIALILLSAILGLGSAVLIGAKINAANVAFQLVKGIGGWLIASAIIYFAVLLLKGKQEMKHKFASFASGLSLTFVYISLFTLIMLAANLMFMPPAYVSLMKIGFNEHLTDSEILELSLILQSKDMQKLNQFTADRLFTTENRTELEGIITENQTLLSPSLMATLIVLQLLLVVFLGYLVVPYMLISETGKFGLIGNILILALVLAVMGFAGNVYSTIQF